MVKIQSCPHYLSHGFFLQGQFCTLIITMNSNLYLIGGLLYTHTHTHTHTHTKAKEYGEFIVHPHPLHCPSFFFVTFLFFCFFTFFIIFLKFVPHMLLWIATMLSLFFVFFLNYVCQFYFFNIELVKNLAL
jgi:hypothetical protein